MVLYECIFLRFYDFAFVIFTLSDCLPEVHCNETLVDDATGHGGLSFGDSYTYTCNPGFYWSDGNITRICLEDSEWSGAKPTCSSKANIIFRKGVKHMILLCIYFHVVTILNKLQSLTVVIKNECCCRMDYACG